MLCFYHYTTFVNMKELKISAGAVTLVDDEDYERLMTIKWMLVSRKWTCYANANIRGKNLQIHRFILGVTDPKLQVDHIDGNGLNNQKSNLRVCLPGQNICNRRMAIAVSGFKGVHITGSGKWMATIRFNKKQYYLGSFLTKEEAARAYNEKAIELHGEFASINYFGKEPERAFLVKRTPLPDRKRSDNTSGFCGVSYIKKLKKWKSAMVLNGNSIYMGLFAEAIDAAKSYDKKAFELHGAKARLNFPEDFK